MFGLVTSYLAVAGGIAAGAQVARGAVRGAGRLAQGDARAALAEVAGGLAAPLVAASHQLHQLGGDVVRSAEALSDGLRQRSRPSATPAVPRVRSRRRAPAAAVANGVA
jgi:hypothetical protein